MPTYAVGGGSATNFIRACLYGIGSSCKTSFGTRLPEEWGYGIYIAADTTSPRLKSILPADRKRLFVVIPNGDMIRAGDNDPTALNKDEVIHMDWKTEAYNIAQRNWPRWIKEHGVTSGQFKTQDEADAFADGMTPGFVIWDGGTGTGDKLLAENARKNYFSEKGPSTGSPHESLEVGTKWKLPQTGDYLMVGSECLEIIEWNNLQPHHVIMCFQEAIQQTDTVKFRDTLFGPCHVGRAGPRQIPNRFDAILYMSREESDENPEGLLRVQMRQANYHVAGIKTADMAADIPVYRLIEKDPQVTRDFWRWLERLGNPAIEEVEVNVT